MRYDDLPAGVDYGVLDAAINSGVGRAPKWLASALGVPAGPIGDLIAPAKAAPDKVKLIQKQWAVRLSFLRGLGTFWRFGKGWTRRCVEGEAASVKMWLKFGAALPDSETKKRLDAEAKAAKQSAGNSGKGAVASGSGSAIGGAAADWSHMPLWEWLLIGGGIVLVACIAVVLIRQAIIHNMRSTAYAAA
jgi:lysozyme family protein